MSIEVRQLIVKSNVLQKSESPDDQVVPDLEEIKKQILANCKELIQEALRESRER
jgi:hypothetical protein